MHDFDNTKFFEGCLPIEVMAHRGARHAAVRADEAGGPARSADGPAAVCGGAAPAGQPGRRSLQPRRVSDADQMERADARAADDSRARAGRVRAARHDPPQHLHQRSDGAEPRRGRRGRVRICSSPARCPASRATSSRPRRACSPGRNAARLAAGPRAARDAADDRDRRARPTTCHTRIRRHYDPTNITFGILPPLDAPPKSKQERALATSARALAALETDGHAKRRSLSIRSHRHARRSPVLKDQIAPVPRLSSLQPQRLAAHVARVRHGSHAVPDASRRARPA